MSSARIAGLRLWIIVAGVLAAVSGVQAAGQDEANSRLSLVEQQYTPDDCDIPFDELRTRSKSCLEAPSEKGRQCERVVPAQFTEVLALSLWPAGAQGGMDDCSGTLIAPAWALSAAHCFERFPQAAASAANSLAREITPRGKSVQVRAHAALLLTEAEKENWAVTVYTPPAYVGQSSSPPFANDLALLRLAHPFPADRIDPASIAKVPEAETTSAGYGVTDASNNENWGLTVTWPARLITKLDQSRFIPQPRAGLISGFCVGDSGGPVFSGRDRGCRSTSLVPEHRPRLLQGVISYVHSTPPRFAAAPAEIAASCRSADGMFIQNITYPSTRKWICQVTKGAAKGCP